MDTTKGVEENKEIKTNVKAAAKKENTKKTAKNLPSTRNRAKSTIVSNFEQKTSSMPQSKKETKPVETIGENRFKNLLSMFDNSNKEKENFKPKEDFGIKKLEQNKINFGNQGTDNNTGNTIGGNNNYVMSEGIQKKMQDLLNKGKQEQRRSGNIDPILKRIGNDDDEEEEEDEVKNEAISEEEDLGMSDEEEYKEDKEDKEEEDLSNGDDFKDDEDENDKNKNNKIETKENNSLREKDSLIEQINLKEENKINKEDKTDNSNLINNTHDFNNENTIKLDNETKIDSFNNLTENKSHANLNTNVIPRGSTVTDKRLVNQLKSDTNNYNHVETENTKEEVTNNQNNKITEEEDLDDHLVLK